jgi:putative spermidine/putrescine transport system ATP-binding protein
VTKASVSIRPEDVHLGSVRRRRHRSGTVTFVRDLGGTIETFVETGRQSSPSHPA